MNGKPRIKSAILDKMKKDDALKAKLMEANGRGFYTIRNWIKANDVKLTTSENLNIIASHYGKLANDILTK